MKMKNKILIFLSTVCIACAAFAFSMPSAVGMAEENTATETPTYGFYMEDGAAIRIRMGDDVEDSDKCTGIRFATNVTKDYYTNTLKKTYTDATSFVLTTEIAPAAGNYTPKPYTWTLTDDLVYVDGVCTFWAALDYSDLTEEQRVKAIAMDLKATTYITVTKADTTTIKVDAEANSGVVRSMRAVAVAALQDPKTDADDKVAIKNYLGNDETGASESTVYLETSEAKAFESDYTAAYIDAEKVAENTLGGAAVAGLTLGEKGELVLFDNANNYKIVPFQYVTKAIENYTDLQSLLITTELVEAETKTIDGYYALTKDLDFLSNEYAIFHHAALEAASGLYSNNTEMGLVGTFDGNGYTLSVKLGWYGLFGKIGAGATIKNLILNAQFEKASNYTSRGTSVFAYKTTANEQKRSSVENVWINVVEDNSTGRANPCVIFVNSNYLGWKNFVVSYSSVAFSYDLTKNGGIFCVNDAVSQSTTFTNNTSNCYVISSEKVALTNLTSSPGYTYYASNDQATVTYYKNFKRLEKLSDLVNENIYADWVWTYDSNTGKIVLK